MRKSNILSSFGLCSSRAAAAATVVFMRKSSGPKRHFFERPSITSTQGASLN
jgi:hypothetical protein